MTNMIKTKDAKKGGYLVGKPHSEGGIKGINVDTNQPIEVEGGEVVITKPAVESNETYNLDGVEMKPREILSKINSDHGGVKFQQGGEIDNTYDTGGEIVNKEREAINKASKFGIHFNPQNKNNHYVEIEKITLNSSQVGRIGLKAEAKQFYAGIETGTFDVDFNDIYQVGDFVYIDPYMDRNGDENSGYYGDGSTIFSDPSPFVPWQITELHIYKRKQTHPAWRNKDYMAMNLYKVYEDNGEMKEAELLFVFDDFGVSEESQNMDAQRKRENKEPLRKLGFNDCYSILIKNIGNTRVPFDKGNTDYNGFPIVYPPTVNEYVTNDAKYIGQLGFFTNSVLPSSVAVYRLNFQNNVNDKSLLNYSPLISTSDKSKFLETNRFGLLGRNLDEYTNELVMVGDKVTFKFSPLNNPTGKVIHVTKLEYIKRDNFTYYYAQTIIETLIVSTEKYKNVKKDEVSGTVVGFYIDNRTKNSGLDSRGFNLNQIYVQIDTGEVLILDADNWYASTIEFGTGAIMPITPQFWYYKDPSGKKKKTKKEKPEPPATPPATPATPAEILEAEIQAKKKKDESDALKYELLLDALEMEETKLIVMRAVATDNPIRLKEIDRKLEIIARKKGEYSLKKDTSLDLLDKLQDAVEAEKFTQEAREYNMSINGDQSELTPSQYIKVRTENFMDWFGNWIEAYELYDYTGVSKVINPRTAEPLVLYHGTDKDFKEWTFDQFPAAYFADNLSYSEWFAGQKSTGGNGEIYEVFLSLKNPIDFRMYGTDEITMKEIFSHLETEYGIKSKDFLPVLKTLDATALDRALKLKLKVWQFVRKTTGFINYLKNETFFDGILMFEDNPDDRIGGIPNTTGSYVAFHTSQIKWSTAKYFNPAISRNDFALGGAV